jgi:glycosyltransferase involved in cell wall biosynthesis
VKTIAQAIESALAQRTDFEFNVIVVDNHSTDGTGDEIERVAAVDSRVVRIVPQETDLGIGGCWNQAVFSPQCGRYCVQLDSDDLYLGTDVLSRVANLFRTGCLRNGYWLLQDRRL